MPDGEKMPDWLKYAVIGVLAAGSGNVGQYVGFTQPAQEQVAEQQANSDVIRDSLASCHEQLQQCWRECRGGGQ